MSRGRKIVLFSTVFIYLLITAGLFIFAMYMGVIDSSLINLYTILTGLILSVYGFYTGTASDGSKRLADKSAKIILDKMKELEKK